MIMRLFVAVEIPGEIRKKLASAQKRIGDGSAGIKWVEEHNLHVTMKFLGEVDEGKAGEIKEALDSVKQEPFTCDVNSIGTFPNEDYIKVIWAGIEPEQIFRNLHEKIEKALEPFGFGMDSRFHPHITLGRVRSVKDRERLRKSVAEIRSENFGSFDVGEFRLKKSTLTPGGPVYEDV
jgi:2'-5' RNA ligase